MGRDEEAEELDLAEAEDDEVDEETGRGAGGFAAGIALGAFLGVAAALLFAPASGAVTRRRLGRKLRKARDVAEDQWDSLSERAKREIKRRTESS